MEERSSEPGREWCGIEEPQPATATRRARVFHDFMLDPDRGQLLHGGTEIALRPKSFAVLEYLIDNAGQLVTRAELLSAVWGETIVTDDSVTHCIADIRKALGKAGPEIVRTVPRRGYVFCAPVTSAVPDENSGPEQPEKENSSFDATRGRFRSAQRLRPIGMAGLLVAFVTIAWWVSRDSSAVDEPAAPRAPSNSIAVLRFADMSERQDQSYLADGLADEILHILAQIPGLLVISRTSSFALEGEDIATVAASLNVANVLEGSVRRSDGRIRVTAQLVDAQTSTHRWSKTFDRELDEVFELQSEIAGEVARALQTTLSGGIEAPGTSPRDPRAHELFLRGHFFYNRRAPGDIERAHELYVQALRTDPDLARAWVGLAAIYNLYRRSHRAPEVAVASDSDAHEAPYGNLEQRHREAVEQALRLAPNLPETHVRAAMFHGLDGNPGQAVEHFERAVSLDPEHPLVLGLMAGHYLRSGRLDESIALLQRAVLRDPLGAVTRYNLGHFLLMANRLGEARSEFEKVVELGRAVSHGVGSVGDAVLGIGKVLLLQRQYDEAREWIERWPDGHDRDYALAMLGHATDRPVEADTALERLIASTGAREPYRIAEVFAYRAQYDDAIAWLKRIDSRDACLDHSVLRAVYSPFLAAMTDDPRWQAWRTDNALELRECAYLQESVSM